MIDLQVIVEGLIAGAIPGLLAAGLALVHRTTGVLSFAHGAVGAAGAYAAWSAGGTGAIGTAGGAVGGALLAAAVGGALALPLGPATRRLGAERPRLAILLTLGWALILEAALRFGFGSDVKAFLHVFVHEAPVRLPFGGALPRSELLLLAVVVAAAGGGSALLRMTRVGRALRAVGSSREAAGATLGLPLARLELIAWGISGAAAGLSGWLVAPRLGLEPTLMWGPMVTGFVAAALGGLDHPGRALLAGLGLGLIERLSHLGVGHELAPILRWAFLGLALALTGRRSGDHSR